AAGRSAELRSESRSSGRGILLHLIMEVLGGSGRVSAQIGHLLLRRHSFGCKQQFAYAPLHLGFGVDSDQPQVRIPRSKPVRSRNDSTGPALRRSVHADLPVEAYFPIGPVAGVGSILQNDPLFVWGQ